jgi:Fe(3+) dicitrate transport protein
MIRSFINTLKYQLVVICLLVGNFVFGGEISGTILNTYQIPVKDAIIQIEGTNSSVKTDEFGKFTLNNLKAGSHLIVVNHDKYQVLYQRVQLNGNSSNEKVKFHLFDKVIDLILVDIEYKSPIGTGQDVTQYEVTIDKTKLEIQLDPAKNPSIKLDRGIIAPITIMEYDGAGLQIGIGGRGLNPKRTAHFNTRQNGYDISADALGYPETYYTPPAEAISKISIIRGAASLQFGPQFGGLINFKLKEGPQDPNKKIEFITSNKYGSYNQFHSFNSFASKTKKLKTYSFYHLKTGDGWRDNSKYTSHTGYIGLDYMPKDGLNIKLQLTHHQYLAQQAGGLTDKQFNINPQASFRERNWFNVNWNIAALIFNYNFNKDFWINSKFFGVHAERNSVGFIQPSTLSDPGAERTLITGQFQNIGNETRVIKRYKFYKKKDGVFIAGIRAYKGWAQTGQGTADTTSSANFKYFNGGEPENSQYTFPSNNLSLFAEHSFFFSKKLSVTPGARYELINTETGGYFNRYLIGLNGDTLDVLHSENASKKNRNFFLTGLGISYRLKKGGKITGNFSQNFRSVNFSDINIVIPNFRVDPDIADEYGHNIDLTYNKTFRKKAFIGLTGYYLYYANRIGVVYAYDDVTAETYQLRTNVSASRTLGMELSAWADIAKLTNMNDSTQKLNIQAAVTMTDAKYIEEDAIVYGNSVEMVPSLTIKSGITYEYKNFLVSGVVNFQSQQFSESTNAEKSLTGVYGIIPSFYVVDAKVGYTYKKFIFQVSVNNLTDHMYFTQRANSYPGPGIIPSEGRTVFGSVIINL